MFSENNSVTIPSAKSLENDLNKLIDLMNEEMFPFAHISWNQRHNQYNIIQQAITFFYYFHLSLAPILAL